MKLRLVLAATAALGLLAAAGASSAASPLPGMNDLTYASFGGKDFSAPSGQQIITSFETSGAPTFANIIFNYSGFSLTGNASAALFTGHTGNSASPAVPLTVDPSGEDSTQYLTLYGHGTVNPADGFATLHITRSGVNAFGLYSGSLDGYNHIVFHYAGTNVTDAVDGGWIAGNTGGLVTDNGNQSSDRSNGRLTFQFDRDLTSIDFYSTTNSFEISHFSAGEVPEPGAWALMILGFGGVGAALRSRRKVLGATA